MHVHTRYSGHSLLRIDTIAAVAKRRGLDAVAVTDHNEIRGALELARLMPTVVGEEVSCDEGDIIGLFLTERIEGGPALEVIDEIHSQGGLVMIPHPFDRLRKEALMNEELCGKGDVIEIFNSRVLIAKDNAKAAAFAKTKGIPSVVGSDAHTSIEVGRSWVDVESCSSPEPFMKSISNARLHTKRSPFYVHIQTGVLKIAEALR